MVKRRDFAPESMIPAAKCARFFQWKNVGGLFRDAEQLTRTRRVGADFADFVSSKESAQIAGMNRLTRVCNRTRNLLRLIATRAHHPQFKPFGPAGTDARHVPQMRNQVPDRRRIFCFPQHVLTFIPSAIASVAG